MTLCQTVTPLRLKLTKAKPDLLNFKKGWMTKLYEDGMWKKHWFVLTDQSLRYYKDSIAEEASDADGEIDLSTCYDVKEFPVQRNYGFQILCKEGACTLSAMTSGIRRNWIQAIMKNVRPTIAPDVTRKNLSLKLSVLKPRSLPEDNLKVTLEPCSQSVSEQDPNPSESPKPDVNNQCSSNNSSTPPSEPRKSRIRERRREGRSKTYDWTEFKMEKPEKPAKERADTVDLSSSFSPNSSYSSSSNPSSMASSPASTSSQLQSTTEDRVTAAHSPSSYATSNTSTSPLGRECLGKMEIDHPSSKGGKGPGVRDEIEQRWHQVETTPLREEKQVPIATASTVSSNSDRLPPHELAELLDKELGQKQKELDQLQKQNDLLKEQLEDALGREQSAREGYVLQCATPPSSSPQRVPWHRLHRLNQDLQGELDTQKRKQDLAQQQIRTLKRSFTEAQEAVDRHETDIQALQAKLASAMAEILASEQAVARMRNELKLEQVRSKEQEEEHNCSEATLRAQLKDSEDRLRQVEATLLERSQALRHLERQQALQRDHLRETQRLQERLQEVTARLSATEEGQALKEERLRKEQQTLKEAHEREKQSLCRRLAEAQGTQKNLEDRLLEAEQQVEALLHGRQSSAGQEEQILKLHEELSQKSNTLESLRESVRRLEEEKAHLMCRCQELLNQIAEADREVNKLHSRLEAEEAEYYTLEHSYERATEEFQKMSQFLREKEQDILQTKEMYERLVERKEEDLKEAFVKINALGNSLEETEQKLQAKEELLCQMSQRLLEPCDAEKELQAKLVIAEDRISELEQHLHALQLGYAGLSSDQQTSPEKCSQDSVVSNAQTPSDVKELAEAHKNLHQRETALKTIIEAAKSPDLKNIIKEIKKSLGLSKHKLADVRPPELAPYMEQIEVEEARVMADEIVERNLPDDVPMCGVDSIHSLENAHEILARELQRQAAILLKYAQELEHGDKHPELAKMIHALLGRQASHQVTSTSLCMREALIQSQVAYVACRLRAMHEQDLSWYKQANQNMDALVQQHAQNISAIQEKYEASIEEHRQNFSQRVESLEHENQSLQSEIGKQVRQLSQQREQMAMLEERFREEAEKLRRRHKQELENMEEERAAVEEVMETTADGQKRLEEQHQSRAKALEAQFELKICELQRQHKEEVRKLQECAGDRSPLRTGAEGQRKGEDHSASEVDSMTVLKERIQELENQMDTMRDELESKSLDGDTASLREKYQRDFDSLKATCERGFTAMEETHQKVIEDIQRQHQREISKLMEERERLLAEETAATIAAIEAMKNAHKEELEKTQRSQISGLNSDIDELRIQYEEELQSIHRELEVLSEQYSQKCLENAHLAQALEAERQALRQCQRENQELNAHNQELNNRLTTEITRMRSCLSGETAMSPFTQGKDVYELEVLLRIKESEIQYLKQEIHSLKDELQSALRDKKYAADKYKDIYTELSIVKAKADCDITKLKEKLLLATEALGERNVDGSVSSGYDIMKSKSNPDFTKKEQSAAAKPSRGIRSKSVTEQVSWDS
uniref:PH domain-containing protein n=1 Tax=Knipowitschia caucasica TaxID=637954 RepID=A0AAV2LCP4_KNICA